MALVVARSPEEWLARFGPERPSAIVTIGNFDGVHSGHQKILRAVLESARRSNSLAVVVTFDPHPLSVVRPGEAPPLLMTLRQRLMFFEKLGLGAALVLRFDRILSLLNPEEFVRRIVVETLRARSVLVGANFRFGHRQTGNVKKLVELGREFGFKVETIPPLVVRGVVVSSTEIRRAVREGDVARAARLLGRPYSLEGEIVVGSGQGRQLVVPTLNLLTEQELLPRTGVYVTQTRVGGRLYQSATNVGVRPTFDGRHLTIESHLFEFSEEIRSGAMELLFWNRLRDEMKFGGPEALRRQIGKDLTRAKTFFERLSRSRHARQSA